MVSINNVAVTVITTDSPLGKALLGAVIEDDVSIGLPGGSDLARIADLW